MRIFVAIFKSLLAEAGRAQGNQQNATSARGTGQDLRNASSRDTTRATPQLDCRV